MASFKTLFLLALANLLFGLAYPFVKSILGYLDPAQWLFVRCSASILILLAITRKDFVNTSLSPRDFFWILVACIFGVLINQICLVEALTRTIPAHAAVINATIPLQTLFYSRLFLGESLKPVKIAGIALGLVGIIYLLGPQSLRSLSVIAQGDLLSFANASAYSLYLVIAKKKLSHLKPLTTLLWMYIIALIGFGFYANWHPVPDNLFRLPSHLYLYMLYLVLVPSIFGFGIYLWALKKIDASHAALFGYFQPLSATVAAFFILGNLPDQRFYISAILIFLGILLGSWKKQLPSKTGSK